MPFKVKANPELFDAWNLLGEQIKLLSSIAQNDMELTPKDLAGWCAETYRLKKAIEDLRDKTVDLIVNEEKE